MNFKILKWKNLQNAQEQNTSAKMTRRKLKTPKMIRKKLENLELKKKKKN
jgi:hypothetical protein